MHVEGHLVYVRWGQWGGWHLFHDLCGGQIRRQELKPNGETKARRGCMCYGVCVCVCPGHPEDIRCVRQLTIGEIIQGSN